MPTLRPRVSYVATASLVLALLSLLGALGGVLLIFSGGAGGGSSALGTTAGVAVTASGLVSAVLFWVLGRIAEDVHVIRQHLNR